MKERERQDENTPQTVFVNKRQSNPIFLSGKLFANIVLLDSALRY